MTHQVIRNPPQIDVINVSPITSHIETYDNIYAIIIAPRFHDENPYINEIIITNGEKPCQWRNVSLLYSTLISNLGVKKDNCILMYDNDGISDMILDIDGDGLSEDVGSDFDGDGINDIDFPCKASDIDMVFKELSGTNNNVPSIPSLTTEDVLMVYTIGVGFESNPYILPGYTDYPYLYCHEGGGWVHK